MHRSLILAAVALSLSLPAQAGEGLICEGEEDIAVSIALGGGVGLSPLSAEITALGQVWSTDASRGTPIAVAQSFGDDDAYYFDFADADQMGIVARVRLSVAHEDGSEPAFGGVLSIAGTGAWFIACGGG
jgi:hypothetical protein